MAAVAPFAGIRPVARRRGRRSPRQSVPPLREPIEPARAGGLDRAPPAALWALVIVVSGGAHLAALRAASFGERPRAVPIQRPPLRVVVVDRSPPPPVEAPPPELPRIAKITKPERRKLISPHEPPVAPQPPPPAPSPREEAPPSKQPPLLVPGMSLSSTSTSGSFAVPVGNTLHGRPGAGATGDAPSGHGTDAAGAAGIAPGYALTEEPVFLDNVSAAEVRRFYPEEARRAKTEGVVRVKLTVGVDGHVGRIVVADNPGSGFGEAATKIARLYRFKPARIGGRAVATEIPFTIRFVLD